MLNIWGCLGQIKTHDDNILINLTGRRCCISSYELEAHILLRSKFIDFHCGDDDMDDTKADDIIVTRTKLYFCFSLLVHSSNAKFRCSIIGFIIPIPSHSRVSIPIPFSLLLIFIPIRVDFPNRIPIPSRGNSRNS